MTRVSAKPAEITNKVWNLSNVLRDDGIVFHKYLSELTYLLFLKIAEESKSEGALPPGCKWSDLDKYPCKGILGHYRKMLTQLGEDSANEIVREIFGFPTTVFSHDENLYKVVKAISSIEWSDVSRDSFGTIYESLLERNAAESRSGAGQYFTPRALVDSIVRVMDPCRNDLVQDPAAGTGGFLISAHDHIKAQGSAKTSAKRAPCFEGIEIERDTYRLCLMNLFLHQMNGKIIHGDALTADVEALSMPDVILANPPFGTGAGGARPKRPDLPYQTPNKQLMFVQHIYLALKDGGRAAVIVPDNVLFEPGVGRKIRSDLMARCDLHTILRLPQGIFYAQGVNTNVIFFNKGRVTKRVWYFDLRTNVRRFNKRNPLSEATFGPFIKAYGNRGLPDFGRRDGDFDGRLRSISREEIAEGGENLDLTWLTDSRSEYREANDIQTTMSDIAASLNTALADLGEIEKEIFGR